MEILVNDVSRFILKRDASVRVWYHRESVEMIKNPNIPRQFNINYEWREVLSTETTENIDSNNDCSCPKEEIFDNNWRNGVFKSPGC
uniref:Uncharacterized protein n=1 Tax=Meloidogyne floridensis TaxID=298350 RepID=A0A915NT05_9BILA